MTTADADLEKEALAVSLGNRIDAAVRQADRSHDVELQGQRVELLAEIAGLQRQEESLDRRVAALTVRSPIDGVVAASSSRVPVWPTTVSTVAIPQVTLWVAFWASGFGGC